MLTLIRIEKYLHDHKSVQLTASSETVKKAEENEERNARYNNPG